MMTYYVPTLKTVLIFDVFFYYPQTPWKRRRCIATCHPSRRSISPATTACTVCRPRRLTPRKNRRRPHRQRKTTAAFRRSDSDRPPSRPALWPLRRRPRPLPPPPPARTTDSGRSRASGRSASPLPARTSTSSAWASSDRPARKCSSNPARRRSGDLTAPPTNSDRHTTL